MKKLFILAIGIMVLFGSCARSFNTTPCITNSNQAGFFQGCWDGSILPLSFIGSLISDDIAIYAVNNTGNWYDFGFVIGLSGMVWLFGLIIEIAVTIWWKLMGG